MSKTYYTADQHLGGAGVIEYCQRPFKSVEHQTDRIIAEANSRAKAGDTLVIVGDVVAYGREQGREGARLRWPHYRDMIHADTVVLQGNHDEQNKTKTIGHHLFTKVGGFRAFVSHYPTDAIEQWAPDLIQYVYGNCDFALCGHVHNAWKTRAMLTHQPGRPTFLNINIGVDVWKYRPVSVEEIVNEYNKWRK